MTAQDNKFLLKNIKVIDNDLHKVTSDFIIHIHSMSKTSVDFNNFVIFVTKENLCFLIPFSETPQIQLLENRIVIIR